MERGYEKADFNDSNSGGVLLCLADCFFRRARNL